MKLFQNNGVYNFQEEQQRNLTSDYDRAIINNRNPYAR